MLSVAISSMASRSARRSLRCFAGERDITVLILGPPGGGKGTISKKLVKDFGLVHISTGDVLRANVANGTALGTKAKEYMATGALVPDSLMVDLVAEELGKTESGGSEGSEQHVLLDGFPRTLAQATALDERCSIDLALNLAVPSEEIVSRISNRRVHQASGRVYADDFNPPKVPGKDDVTGEPLIQRDDDKPEFVRTRLQAYDDNTAPLLGHYDKKGVLHNFDGSESPDLVAANRRSDAIYKELKPILASKIGA